MAVADTRDLQYGAAELAVRDIDRNEDTVRVFAQVDPACSGGVGDYPCHHYAAGTNINVEIDTVTDNSDLIDPYWTVAIVKSNQDVNGDYSQGQSEVPDEDGFGRTSNISAGDTVNMSAGGVEAGLYRLVLMAGDRNASSTDINEVDTGSTSGDYHYDTDGNVAEGGVREGDSIIRDAGVVFGTISFDDAGLTPTAQGYPDTPEQVITFSPFGESGAEYADCQGFGLEVTDSSDGSNLKEVVNDPGVSAPGSTGTFSSTQAYNIDTELPESATEVDIVAGLGETAGNGFAPPPSLRPALDTGSGDIDGFGAGRQSWTVFRGTPPAGTKVDPVDGEWYTALRFPAAATLGHGIDIGTVERATTPTASDPGTQLYNRGETVDIDIELIDVFGAAIDPDDTTVEVQDENGQTEYTTTQSAGPYTIAYTIGGGDTADYNTLGSPKPLLVAGGEYFDGNPTATFDAAASFPDGSFPHRVSRKLLVGAGTADAFQNARTIDTDEAVYNRGETATLEYNASYARGEGVSDRTIASTVVSAVGVDEDTKSLTPATSGAVTHVHPIDVDDAATPDTQGSPKTVDTGDTLGNTADPITDAYSLSRAFQHSTERGTITTDNEILTGTQPSPAVDETTVRNRGEQLYFTSVLHNARGEPLNGESVRFNVREIDTLSYESDDQQTALTAGTLAGSDAGYTIESDAPPTERALVVADAALAPGNQPPAGTQGVGNVAETARTEADAEYTVSDEYQVETRLQTASSLDETVAETTSFLIAAEVVQTFAEVTNQSGNPKSDVPIDFTQYAPAGSPRQTDTGTTHGDGWTANKPFDTRAPAEAGWTMESTLASDVDGNSGGDQQTFTMVSPFAGDIAAAVRFGPVTGASNTQTGETLSEEGKTAVPGDRVRVSLNVLRNNERVAPDPAVTPEVLIARVDGDTERLEVLQANGTFRAKGETTYSEQWFDLKRTQETDENGDPLVYLTDFGTADQGVDSDSGYTMDTGNWPKGGLVVTVRYQYDDKLLDESAPFAFGHRSSDGGGGGGSDADEFDGVGFVTPFGFK